MFVVTHIDSTTSLSVNSIVDGVVALLTYGVKNSAETLHTFLRDQRARAQLSVLLMQLTRSSLLHIKQYQSIFLLSSSFVPIKAQHELTDHINVTSKAANTYVSAVQTPALQRSTKAMIAQVLTASAIHMHSFLNLPGHYFISCKGCGVVL